MASDKNNRKKDIVKLENQNPKGEVCLENIICQYPFDIKKTEFWKNLYGCSGKTRCCHCCCCCCEDQRLNHDSHDVLAPSSSTNVSSASPIVSPAAPSPKPVININVSFSAKAYVLVIGGTISSRVEFDWSASGSNNISVNIEIRSTSVIGTFPSWTSILTSKPAIGRDVWYPLTYSPQIKPGERLEFRATAYDSQGNRGTSNVITI